MVCTTHKRSKDQPQETRETRHWPATPERRFCCPPFFIRIPKLWGDRPYLSFLSLSRSLSYTHASLSLSVRTSWNRTKGVYSISLHHPQSLLIMNFRTEKFLGVTAPISELESNEREKEVTVTLMEELRRQGTFESEAEAKTRSACNLYSRTPSLVRLCHQ